MDEALSPDHSGTSAEAVKNENCRVSMTEKSEGLEATASPSIFEPADEFSYMVTFDGDDDSQNPLNWSRFRKWTMVAVLSSASLVAYEFP
jgi:hypothetical protein